MKKLAYVLLNTIICAFNCTQYEDLETIHIMIDNDLYERMY